MIRVSMIVLGSTTPDSFDRDISATFELSDEPRNKTIFWYKTNIN